MVGAEAAEALLAYVRRDGCLDPHLADQIVLYLAIAAGRSVFTTTQITSHLVTNIEVITRFLDVEYDVEGEIGSPGKVSVTGAGYHRNAV
jgi:RNA 3'-terminal phosphate cyclase